MRARILGVIVLALAVLAIAPPVHAQAPRPLAVDLLYARSAELLLIVFEGQTSELRLAGIEVAWGMAADARLRRDGLARNRVGLLQLSQPSYDEDGRPQGYVWVDGSMLNELLVAEGYAVPASAGPTSRYRAELLGAARLARNQGLGLWDSCPPTSG
jgi:endonuclease YncB( thermonuclease family)